jgi:site-specific DNA-methyltransferase (adenine-specific)/modification methylase
MTPYYEDTAAGIVIYHGDCREIVPSLAFGGVVLTDPQYGIDHPTEYASRGRGALANCRDYPRVHGDDQPFDPSWLLGVGGARILWGANHYASRLPDSGGWLVWDKERPDDLDQATCELAWTDCIKGVRRFRFLWNGMMRASREPLTHPTQKPEALMRWCLSFRWVPSGPVLDPYMGSGTTLVAAKDCGRPAIGIEIEERYCEIAAKRLAQGVLDFGGAA